MKRFKRIAALLLALSMLAAGRLRREPGRHFFRHGGFREFFRRGKLRSQSVRRAGGQ